MLVLMFVRITLFEEVSARRDGGGSIDFPDVSNQGVDIVSLARNGIRMLPIEQRNGLTAVENLSSSQRPVCLKQ